MPGLADPSGFPELIESTGTSNIPHISDESQELWNRFGVSRQRTYVYIDDDGTFEQAAYGSLASDVEALLAS